MPAIHITNFVIGPPAPQFTHNVDDDFKDQRLGSFIDHYLVSYDVICLQEMFGAFSNRRKQLIRAAKKRGFHWKVSSPQSRSSLFLVDGGCIILSRVKVVSDSSTIFRPGVMSDRLAAKGAIYAKLEPKPGMFIHLFTTHLQAVYADEGSQQQCLDIQKEPYSELVQFVMNTVIANEDVHDMVESRKLIDSSLIPSQNIMRSFSSRWPIYIVGDFNCNSRGPPKPYTDLTSALSQLGRCRDLLFDTLKEHPVTYASAELSVDGGSHFVPLETALTTPDDYCPSGKWINQSLDYIFHIPPTHNGNEFETESCSVRHLEYIADRHPRGIAPLHYLSDHFAVETRLKINQKLTVTEQNLGIH